MHRFCRMHLSPEVARNTLDTIDVEEKSKVAEWLALIAVIEDRRDYLEAGYSCIRDYCMRRYHLSKDKAYRRIQVAKAAHRFPDLYEYIADGRLSVSTASVLVPHLTPETVAELLEASAFQSRDEILRMLAVRSRQVAISLPPDEPVVESSSTSLAPGQVTSLDDLRAPVRDDTVVVPLAVPQVANSRRGCMTHSATGDREVRLTLTDAEYEDLRAAMDLDAHAVPSGDPALVYARAMKHYREHLQKRRLGAKSGAEKPARPCGGRGIPKALVGLVWERDCGRCTFTSADGHRCEETRQLEIDHIMPVALGGETTAENLRVLCRAHNQYEAERVLGKEHVQRRRELAQRERARDKAAAAAGAARDEARPQARKQPRDAEHQARYDDIHAALRGLGMSDAEARRGAAMADALPDASLEACLKHVLPILTRPVALRGERIARSTA
jgi:hypothetical protein